MLVEMEGGRGANQRQLQLRKLSRQEKWGVGVGGCLGIKSMGHGDSPDTERGFGRPEEILRELVWLPGPEVLVLRGMRVLG